MHPPLSATPALYFPDRVVVVCLVPPRARRPGARRARAARESGSRRCRGAPPLGTLAVGAQARFGGARGVRVAGARAGRGGGLVAAEAGDPLVVGQRVGGARPVHQRVRRWGVAPAFFFLAWAPRPRGPPPQPCSSTSTLFPPSLTVILTLAAPPLRTRLVTVPVLCAVTRLPPVVAAEAAKTSLPSSARPSPPPPFGHTFWAAPSAYENTGGDVGRRCTEHTVAVAWEPR